MSGRFLESLSTIIGVNRATLSGAIDVITVEQPDGSLRSTPWHIRFGKCQLLFPRSATARLHINGNDTGVDMKIGNYGQAYFFESSSKDDIEKNIRESHTPTHSDSFTSQCAPLPDTLRDQVELSLCGTLLFGTPDSKSHDRDVFNANILSFEQLEEDPSLWYHPSLVCRVSGNDVYIPGKVALPLIASLTVYKKALSPESVRTIIDRTLSQTGTLLKDETHVWSVIRRELEGGKLQPSSPLPLYIPLSSEEESLHPSSALLAKLNLKKEHNFAELKVTSFWGESVVPFSIYRWPQECKIVVSDVDGTVTTSDLKGQISPMLNMDPTQKGICELFTNISLRGYRIIYLSARAIGQGPATKDYLFNIKQEGGFTLPDGPLLLSPARLLTSFKREVIEGRPYLMKAKVLSEIRSYFSPLRTPLFAGFGNREWDHAAYTYVGMPEARVYIINPQGALARVISKHGETYSGMNQVIHEVFPDLTNGENKEISYLEKEKIRHFKSVS